VSGDVRQIQQLRDARDAARRQFAAFEPGNNNPAVQRFMQIALRPGVTGKEIADAMFTAGRLGSSGTTAQILAHIDGLYPVGSEAREVLRNGVAHAAMFGVNQDLTRFTYSNVANNLHEALSRGGREIMERMFSPEQLEQFRSAEQMLRMMEETLQQNKSGTAYTMAQNQVANFFRRKGAAVGMIYKLIGEHSRAVRDAELATSGRLYQRVPRPADMPIGMARRSVPAGTGGYLGSQGDVQPALSGAATALMHPVDTAHRAGNLLFSNWDR
jgi:hypothetical protein